MDTNILPVFSEFDLKNFQHAITEVKQVFNWLPLLASNTIDTYCLLNCGWNADSYIDSIPQNYDRYIISFNLEYPDFEWIKKLCKHFFDRQVVCIIQFDNAHVHYNNLTYIKYDVLPSVIKMFKQHNLIPDVVAKPKKYKISALNARIDQFKAYTSAHLVKNHHEQDYLISWLGQIGKPMDLFWLESITQNKKIDDLTHWIKQTNFCEQKRLIDDFKNTPAHNWMDFTNPAYTDAVVNLTNESMCHSLYKTDKDEFVHAGPYITDKTIKPLLGCTALLPVGQYQTYNYLTVSGFNVEYPWKQDFDQDPGNITRASKILDTIDEILGYSLDDLDKLTKESRVYNREHMLNDGYYNMVNISNKESLAKHGCC